MRHANTHKRDSRSRSAAISVALLELKTLSSDIRSNAAAFRDNLDRVAHSEAIAGMRRLLDSVR